MSPAPTSTTSSGELPCTAVVAIRVAPPTADSTAAPVSSFVVDAGTRALAPPTSSSASPVAASSTDAVP
jgi:hypothetical protein